MHLHLLGMFKDYGRVRAGTGRSAHESAPVQEVPATPVLHSAPQNWEREKRGKEAEEGRVREGGRERCVRTHPRFQRHFDSAQFFIAVALTGAGLGGQDARYKRSPPFKPATGILQITRVSGLRITCVSG